MVGCHSADGVGPATNASWPMTNCRHSLAGGLRGFESRGGDSAGPRTPTTPAQRKTLSSLHPSTILKPNPDPNTHPNPQPSPKPSPTPTPTPSPKPSPSPNPNPSSNPRLGSELFLGSKMESNDVAKVALNENGRILLG